jgi:hypothetical protein
MARVEIPAPADVVQDQNGSVRAGVPVALYLAGTVTPATHYSALTGGTSTTGGLTVHTDGTIRLAGAKRYVDSGVALDTTITPSGGSVTRRLEPMSAAAVAAIEYNIRDQSGLSPNGDSSTDSTAAINAAIVAASAAASARGLSKVRLWGFGTAKYYVGQLVAKSNVELILDEATLVARAAIASNGAMVRNADALADLFAAVAVGTATVTNTSYQLTALSSVASFYEGMPLTGTGIPASTKVLFVDKAAGTAVMDKPATATNTGVTITRAATHYGRCDDFSIIGGTLDPNGFNVGPAMRLFYTRNLRLQDVTVLHNMGTANWALALGGRNGKIKGLKILGGNALLEDGVHISHGSYWSLSDYYIESGDDAIALNGDFTDPALLRDPEAIRHVTVGAGEVRAQRGAAFAAFVNNGATGRDWEVTDYRVTGLVGRAGILRNGGLKLRDDNNGAVGTSQVRRGGVQAKLEIGSTNHDESGAVGAYLQSLAGIDLDAELTITQKAAPSTPYVVWRALDCDDVTLRRGCRESVSAGTYTLTDFQRNGMVNVE